MIGLTPAQISPYVIKKAGFANAKKLMITAEKFTGDKAREYKLADYLFNSIEELNEIEEKLKKQILQCAPRAIIETKKILDLAFEGINQDFIDYASKNFVDQIVDGEGREGILSFVEKREPNWKK
jgi:isohexenylglutaconyl-CoA hydratase